MTSLNAGDTPVVVFHGRLEGDGALAGAIVELGGFATTDAVLDDGVLTAGRSNTLADALTDKADDELDPSVSFELDNRYKSDASDDELLEDEVLLEVKGPEYELLEGPYKSEPYQSDATNEEALLEAAAALVEVEDGPYRMDIAADALFEGGVANSSLTERNSTGAPESEADDAGALAGVLERR